MKSFFENHRYIIISFVAHILFIFMIFLLVKAKGCSIKKEPIEIVEFTIAALPQAPEEPAPIKEIKEESPPLPPKPDDITIEKPKEKKVEAPKPQKKDPPKEKKSAPIKKGVKITKTIPAPKEKPLLSDAEMEKWLNRGARIGEKTSIPKNEVSLNASMLKNSFYRAWQPPTREASGTRPAVVSFDITNDGTLLNPRISTSSGSSVYDQSCLDAVRRTKRVTGLSASFIKTYGRGCEFEFKQKE